MSSDDTSDSGLNEEEYENLGLKKKKSVINKIRQQNVAFRKNAKLPTSTSYASFHSLSEALDILNTPMTKVRNSCMSKKFTNSRIPCGHYSILHCAIFIKRAILRHDWANVSRLLIAYINTPKTESDHTRTILRYAFIFLLNDPVAKENKFLLEFFNTLLFTKTKEEQLDLIKNLMTIPDLDSKYSKGHDINIKK